MDSASSIVHLYRSTIASRYNLTLQSLLSSSDDEEGEGGKQNSHLSSSAKRSHRHHQQQRTGKPINDYIWPSMIDHAYLQSFSHFDSEHKSPSTVNASNCIEAKTRLVCSSEQGQSLSFDFFSSVQDWFFSSLSFLFDNQTHTQKVTLCTCQCCSNR